MTETIQERVARKLRQIYFSSASDEMCDDLASEIIAECRALEPLVWECLDGKHFRAKAPLFGYIRVERWSEDMPWEVNWSVPGFTSTLIDGIWDNLADAFAAVEAQRDGQMNWRWK